MDETALFIVFLVVIIAAAYRYAVRRGQKMAMLVSRGTTVTGQVIDARQVRRSRTHKACRVRYGFRTTGGVHYEREIEVLPKELANYSAGQEIEIVYDPADPNNNTLKSAVAKARQAMGDRRAGQQGDIQ